MSSIVRVEKKTNYTIIDNTALRDNRLSWKAKGLMAYMLSMPDDWTFYMEELQKHATDGKSSFRSGFNELKKLGYVERRRTQREDGTFSWETIVYEKPHTDFPQVDKPQMDKPQVDNRKLLNTNKQSTNKQSTYNTKDDDSTLYSTNTINSTPSEARESVSSDQHFAEILKALESILPPMQQKQLYGGILGEEVGQDYEEYGYELQKEAIRKAALAGKSHYGYVHGILRNWRNEGVQTLADVHAKDAQKQKQSSQRSHGGQGMHQTVEDIMNDPTLIKVEKQVLIQELKERGEA